VSQFSIVWLVAAFEPSERIKGTQLGAKMSNWADNVRNSTHITVEESVLCRYVTNDEEKNCFTSLTHII
jgi:vacuolar-type H+-ATPase subunit C/Vma6